MLERDLTSPSHKNSILPIIESVHPGIRCLRMPDQGKRSNGVGFDILAHIKNKLWVPIEVKIGSAKLTASEKIMLEHCRKSNTTYLIIRYYPDQWIVLDAVREKLYIDKNLEYAFKKFLYEHYF